MEPQLVHTKCSHPWHPILRARGCSRQQEQQILCVSTGQVPAKANLSCASKSGDKLPMDDPASGLALSSPMGVLVCSPKPVGISADDEPASVLALSSPEGSLGGSAIFSSYHPTTHLGWAHPPPPPRQRSSEDHNDVQPEQTAGGWQAAD